MRHWRALALVVLVGASAAACSDDGPGEGEAHLEVNGKARVERSDGDVETIDDSTDLDSGDRVTLQEGVASMQLQGGTTFELRMDESGVDGTQVLMDSTPVLESGDLLVSTPESTHVDADGTDVEIREGAARLTRAFGMSASAYDADLVLDSAGVPTEVPALRQVTVPDLGRPRPPRPVDYDAADDWDYRYLGAWMDLDRGLQQLADDLTGSLPEDQGRTTDFFKVLLPSLEEESTFTQDLLEGVGAETERTQGDTLIGAAISDLGARGSFPDRWNDVFSFRDEGAAWGIVALDQAVQSGSLLGSVQDAFNTSFAELTQGPTVGEPSGAEEPTGTDDGGTTPPADTGDGGDDGGTGGGTDGGGGGGTPVPPPTPPTLPPPLTPPPDSEPPAVLDPIVDPVADLADELLGGLLG